MGAFARLLAGLVTRGAATAARGGARALSAVGARRGIARTVAKASKRLYKRALRSKTMRSWAKAGRKHMRQVHRRIAHASRNLAGLPLGGQQGIATAAPPPQIDYGRMIADMGNPNARGDEETRATNEATQERNKQRDAETTQRMAEAQKKFVHALLVAPTAVYGVSKALKEFSEALLDRRRKFAEYSGTIAGAFSRLEYREIRENAETARETQNSTAELAEAVGDMREAWRPLEAMGITFFNKVGTWAARGAAWGAEILKALALIPGLKHVAEEIEGELKKQSLPIGNKVIHDLASGLHETHPARPLPPLR